MRVLITGASGFCGTHLVRYLKGQSVEIHTLGRRPAGAGTSHVADPDDLPAITAALRVSRPDSIVHLAGVSHASDVATYYRANAVYAATLIQAAETVGLASCPMLLVGTSAEYGEIAADQLPVTEEAPARPCSHYGISKLTQTLLAQTTAGGRPLIVVRPGNIIGPDMPEHLALPSFARQAAEIVRGRRAPVVEVGNLDGVRDFIDVEDAVAIYWRLLREPAARGQVVNVCTGRGTRVGDLLASLIRLSGATIEVRVDPARLKRDDVPAHVGSVAKLTGLLGEISFTPLDVTLEKIYRAALANL